MATTSHIAPAQAAIFEEVFVQFLQQQGLPNQTTSITFDLKAVTSYIAYAASLGANELRVWLARYPSGSNDEDRITAVIEALKNGQGVAIDGDEDSYPLNGGTLEP